MAILLLSDEITAAASAAATIPLLLGTPANAPIVLLCAGDGAATSTPLAEALLPHLPSLFVIDVNGDRFARLNFDAMRAVVLDFDAETLLSSPGRRLVEVLVQLVTLRETGDDLDLIFVGDAAGATGGLLLDGIHAGLGLIPATAVAPNLKAVPDLRGLLATISAGLGRLIALDAPVALRYTRENDQVQVAGAGSALLVAFVISDKQSLRNGAGDIADSGEDANTPPPTARLHVVTGGMRSSFPGA